MHNVANFLSYLGFRCDHLIQARVTEFLESWERTKFALSFSLSLLAGVPVLESPGHSRPGITIYFLFILGTPESRLHLSVFLCTGFLILIWAIFSCHILRLLKQISLRIDYSLHAQKNLTKELKKHEVYSHHHEILIYVNIFKKIVFSFSSHFFNYASPLSHSIHTLCDWCYLEYIFFKP